MNGYIDDAAIPQSGGGFDVSQHRVKRVVVVTASGDLDMHTAPRLADAIDAARRQRPAALIVDLTNVTFLASAGMNLLLATHLEIHVSTPFGVIAEGEITRRPLMLTGIDVVLDVYPSLEAGLDAFADA